MKSYLIGISVLCQLSMVANYIYEVIQATNRRERILAGIKALICGLIAALLLIGLITFGFGQSS